MELLGIALALHLAKLNLRAIAWRAILRASYPGQRSASDRLRRIQRRVSAINSIVPARGGRRGQALPDQAADAGLELRHARTDADRRDALDFFVAGGLMIWAPLDRGASHPPGVLAASLG